MKVIPDYKLYDIVIMQKEHPCKKGKKEFQIVRVGADIKIMCLGCGNVIMMTRDDFNKRIKSVKEHKENIINFEKN